MYIINYLKFFYYRIKNDSLVDYENNKLTKFPFYDDCKIEFVDIDYILNMVRQIISLMDINLKFLINNCTKDNALINGKKVKCSYSR